MRYAALIYTDETADPGTPEQQMAMFQEYGTFTNEYTEKGVILAGEPLQPTATATTVRVRDGKTLTTDGPFAETKEQLGGFYLFEAKDLDAAIAAAAKIPGARQGSVELRPIMEMEGM